MALVVLALEVGHLLSFRLDLFAHGFDAFGGNVLAKTRRCRIRDAPLVFVPSVARLLHFFGVGGGAFCEKSSCRSRPLTVGSTVERLCLLGFSHRGRYRVTRC